MKKKIICLTLVMGLVLAFSGCSGQAEQSAAPDEGSAGKEVTLRMCTDYSAEDINGALIDEFAAKVKEQTNGTVNIEVYHDGLLFKNDQYADAISSGTLDMCYAMFGKGWPNTIPQFQALGSGWFANSEEALKALNGPFGDYFEQLLEEKANTKLLGWSGAGAVDCMLNNKHPVSKPEDLKGMKLRIANASQMAQVECFGAVGVVMPPNDMYLGVQRGTIDGVYSTSPGGAMTIKLTEIAKYYTRVDVSGTGVEHGFAMNLNKFNSLSKEQQDVLLALGKEYGEIILQAGADMADEHWANLAAKGAEVTVVPEEDIPQWRAIWADAGDKVLKEVVSEEEAQKLYELAQQSK